MQQCWELGPNKRWLGLEVSALLVVSHHHGNGESVIEAGQAPSCSQYVLILAFCCPLSPTLTPAFLQLYLFPGWVRHSNKALARYEHFDLGFAGSQNTLLQINDFHLWIRRFLFLCFWIHFLGGHCSPEQFPRRYQKHVRASTSPFPHSTSPVFSVFYISSISYNKYTQLSYNTRN